MPEMLNFSETLTGKEFTDVLNGVLYDTIKDLYENDVVQIDAFNIVASIGANESRKKKLGGEPSIEIISEIVENCTWNVRGIHTSGSNVMGLAYRRALYKDLNSAQAKVLKTTDLHSFKKMCMIV